jgi:hypothetical protein
MGARVLVCGGRTFSDHDQVFRTLDRLHADNRIELVIHGDARGADRLAQTWAFSNGIPEQAFKAKWDDIKGLSPLTLKRNAHGRLYNPLAGFARNEEMLRACPTHAIAFAGGNGTNDMCKRIRRAIDAGQQIKFIDLRGAQ